MKKLKKRVENPRKSIKICQDRCGRGHGVQKQQQKSKSKWKNQKSKKYKKIWNIPGEYSGGIFPGCHTLFCSSIYGIYTYKWNDTIVTKLCITRQSCRGKWLNTVFPTLIFWVGGRGDGPGWDEKNNIILEFLYEIDSTFRNFNFWWFSKVVKNV